VLERQFRRFFAEAERQTGITGENLMVLLEKRLDNVIFRMGFADSRSQARQLVAHGHFLVNGTSTDIPSYLVKEGDVIGWSEASKKKAYFKLVAESIGSKVVASWLSVDKTPMVGRVVSLPTAGQIETKFDTASVVEYYSR
jgi:small subunit ribosomal protein S4